MAPWLTILGFGILGFLWKGLLGSLAGLVAGYILTLLLGLLIGAIQGGFVPRQARKQTAQRFVESFRAQADAAFPGLHGAALLKPVEESIEKLFQRSMDDNRGGRLALSFPCLQSAGFALSEEAATPALSEFWLTLLGVVEYTMYRKQ